MDDPTLVTLTETVDGARCYHFVPQTPDTKYDPGVTDSTAQESSRTKVYETASMHQYSHHLRNFGVAKI